MPVFKKHKLSTAITLSLPFALGGCNDDNLDPNAINAPDVYEFPSSFDMSISDSTEYSEATTRLLLIYELKSLIESQYLQDYGQTTGVSKTHVKNLLNRIYELGTSSAENSLANSNIYDLENILPNEVPGPTFIKGVKSSSGLALSPNSFDDINIAQNVNIQDKMPGTDLELLYKDIYDKPEFIGWDFSDAGSDNYYADRIIDLCFETIAGLAIDNGTDANDTVSTLGAINYKDLAIYFLLGSIPYSQSTNLHLNTGVYSNHSNLTPNQKYSELEHHWDMAFGYYGAAKHIPQLSSDQIIEKADHNYSGNKLNPLTEYNFSTVIEYEQRDSAIPLLSANYAKKTINAFFEGRKILSDSELMEKYDHIQFANTLIENWEKSLLSNIIHEINNTLYYLNQYSAYPELYTKDYASHWSKLKGLALGLQFNPHTPLTQEEIQTLHNKIASRPQHYSEIGTKISEELSRLTNYYRDLGEAKTLISEKIFPQEDTSNW